MVKYKLVYIVSFNGIPETMESFKQAFSMWLEMVELFGPKKVRFRIKLVKKDSCVGNGFHGHW